ncbi:MAG: hypothetical protein JHC12_04595 [Thermogladius sp.]|nr:hypothetical protein [Thermogladius sp.]
MSEAPQASNPLEDYVKNISFIKLGPNLFILPGLMLFPAIIGALALVAPIITGASLNPIAVGGLTSFFYGFTISAAIASYKLLKAASTHFYDSAVVVYYWSRRENFENILNYLKERRETRGLPSPVTGLLLTFLTGGIGYIPILFLVEKNLREHARFEEEVLFGGSKIQPTTTLGFIRDLLLTTASLGLYLAYWSWRVVALFNTHLTAIHGSHPNRPTRSPPPPSQPLTREDSNTTVLGLVFIVAAVDILLAYLGFYSHLHLAVVLGLSLAYYGLKFSQKPLVAVAIAYGLIYLALGFSTVIGVAGFTTYVKVAELFKEASKSILQQGFLGILAYIFLNNFSIASSSLPPLLGPIVVSLGVANSGVVYGAVVAERNLPPTLFITPHTPLELLGYAFYAAASSELATGDKRALKLFIVGAATLLIAAVVETFLIAGAR